MATFRDLIESSKQQQDPETIRKSKENEFIKSYADFVVESIHDRLLCVARQIAKGITYEYRGILHWENIPPFFFEQHLYSVPKLFSKKIDRICVDINTNGKTLIDRLKKQLQNDGIRLNGPFFSRLPSMRDSDGYFLVEPFSFRQIEQYMFKETISLPFASDFFIIDEYTKITATKIPDRLSFPVDFRLRKEHHGYNYEVSVLQSGSDHVLGKRLNAEGPFIEILYKM